MGDAQEGIQSVFVERNEAGGDMTFVACDVLALDGQGIMGEPWEHRRKRLEDFLAAVSLPRVVGILHGL